MINPVHRKSNGTFLNANMPYFHEVTESFSPVEIDRVLRRSGYGFSSRMNIFRQLLKLQKERTMTEHVYTMITAKGTKLSIQEQAENDFRLMMNGLDQYGVRRVMGVELNLEELMDLQELVHDALVAQDRTQAVEDLQQSKLEDSVEKIVRKVLAEQKSELAMPSILQVMDAFFTKPPTSPTS